MGKKKIAFVVMRYGLDINGGAEYHCRMLAERLVGDYEVEVLTTCVQDYMKGGNEMNDKQETINGVLVRRFETVPVDNTPEWHFNRKAKPVRRLRMFLYRIHCLQLISYFKPVWNYLTREEEEAVKRSIFYSPGLNQFIQEHKDHYDVFIAFTIDYAPFYYTAMHVGEKTIAIPTMHYAKVSFRALLTKAFARFAYVGFNTGAEQQLARRVFGKALGAHGIISTGIDTIHFGNWENTQKKYALPDRYLLYVGRIDPGKVNNIVSHFQKYKEKYPASSLKMVMVGGVFGKIEASPDVIYTGFVSDEEKNSIIQHALLLVNPSQYESLSLILLEALSLNKPMLVNGHCTVLKEHCKLSNGAVDYYLNAGQFVKKLHEIESSPKRREEMSRKGQEYVATNYSWTLILSRLKQAIESVATSSKKRA